MENEDQYLINMFTLTNTVTFGPWNLKNDGTFVTPFPFNADYGDCSGDT